MIWFLLMVYNHEISPSTKSVDCTIAHLQPVCKISTSEDWTILMAQKDVIIENDFGKMWKFTVSHLFSSLPRCSGDGESMALIWEDDLISQRIRIEHYLILQLGCPQKNIIKIHNKRGVTLYKIQEGQGENS